MKQSWMFGAMLAALLTGGCGGDGATSPRPMCAGLGTVTVVATEEARPRFTWTPDCAAASLSVVNAPQLGVPQSVAWAIQGGAAGIASGVRFGVVPKGATEDLPSWSSLPPGFFVELRDADGVFLGGTPIYVSR